MPARYLERARRHVAASVPLQLLLFVVITFAVLLLAEYTGILGA
jgi:hypothetical protein